MQRKFFWLLPTIFIPAATVLSAAEDWPQFRGPTGQGWAAVSHVPLEWSATQNVVWKQPIPGRGWSSPVVVGDRLFLTTAVPLSEAANSDLSLRAMCLAAGSGEVLWDLEIFRQNAVLAPPIHSKNSHASPTPLVSGGRVYVHFGHQGTACLDLEGNLVWQNRSLAYSPVHGNGGSPILVGDRLIFSCDGGDEAFVVGLQRDTGEVVWRTPRAAEVVKKFSFSTPLAIEVAGRTQVISPGSNCVVAYDPVDGRELWRVRYEGYSVTPRPVSGQGLVFICTGYDAPELLAIRPDGAGDVTDTHVAWRLKRGVPLTPSLLLVDDLLYLLSDGGVASCLVAATGDKVWQERIGGGFSASPLWAAGRIYLQSEEGVGTVIATGRAYRRLARNDLQQRTLASLAVTEGKIYLRTVEHLYCISDGPVDSPR